MQTNLTNSYSHACINHACMFESADADAGAGAGVSSSSNYNAQALVSDHTATEGGRLSGNCKDIDGALSSFTKFHFIGIGGSGMAPLAKWCVAYGWQAQGSDIANSKQNEGIRQLMLMGISIAHGHNPGNWQGADAIVFSNAIPTDCDELVSARAAGIKVFSRLEFLQLVLSYYSQTILISGAHGKSTTTAMIAHLLGAKTEPKFAVHLLLGALDSDLRLSEYSAQGADWLVAELDESDPQFSQLPAKLKVLTNVDDEHLSAYDNDPQVLKSALCNWLISEDSEDSSESKQENSGLILSAQSYLALQQSFGATGPVTATRVANRLAERLWVCGSRDQLAKLELPKQVRQIAYEINRAKQRPGFEIKLEFEQAGKQQVHQFALGLPGEHNARNAVVALCAALWVGIAPEQMVDSLLDFRPIARRQQIYGIRKMDQKSFLLVDDYAHHPVEIKATLSAMCEYGCKRIICLFEPHRYSRSVECAQAQLWSGVFADANLLGLLPIDPAGEMPIDGINQTYISEKIEHDNCVLLDDYAHALEFIGNEVRNGDLVLVAGAGKIKQFIGQLTQASVAASSNNTGEL